MKRHPSLISLSSEHHHALVLARSLTKDAPAAMKRHLPSEPSELIEHVRERFARELEPHFQIEERELLTMSEQGNETLREHAQRIAEDHAALRRLVRELAPGPRLDEALDAFGRTLTEHVRYEERSWFPALEAALGEQRLAEMASRLRPVPAAKIVDFDRDEDGDWRARLDCGHVQHVRHEPPWQDRAWVTTREGRDAHLGTWVACPWCRMPKLPPEAREYKRTSEYDERTVPAGLTKSHRLKAGSWGEIVVTSGRVLYVLEDEANLGFVLAPERPGVVAPERPHHVEPQPGASFYVRFLREQIGKS